MTDLQQLDQLLTLQGGCLNCGTCTAGADPEAGKSAYQLWLDAGNRGSLQAFLDSLKGQSGNSASQTISATASELLPENSLVNIYAVSGVFTARLATAADPARYASGYVTVTTPVGGLAVVYTAGNLSGQSLLFPGTVYLSTSAAGIATNTAPVTPGQIVQALGLSGSSTSINVEIEPPIELVG